MALDAGSVFAVLGGKFNPAGFAQFDAAMKKSTASASAAEKSHARSAGAMTMMGSAAKTGAAVGVVALGYALVKSVQSAATFEKKMSELQAVTKANTATMKQMGDAAKDLGAKTGVGATQAAGALTELAKGGLDANTSIAALTGTIALAQAGDMELADAANTVVKSLSLFSLAGADAGHVADGLASAANATSMDVADFAQALAQGGSAAAAAGFSFDDTINIMASMADKFQSGSDLGTSLKTTLVQMANPSKKAADEMKRLNISLFDSNNQIKPVASIVEMLTNRFKGMTDKQKLSTAATIAGTDGMRTLLALTGSSGKNIIVPGSAADIAAKKMDNFAGTMKKFKAELETLGIELGEALLPALTDLAEGLTVVLQTMRGDFSAFSLSTLGDVRAIISTISTAASVMRLIPGPIGDLWAKIGDGAQGAIEGIDKATNKIRNDKIKVGVDNAAAIKAIREIQDSKIAPKVAKILANKQDADSKIKALIALGIPKKIAKVLADTGSADEALRKTQREIAKIVSKTITVAVNQQFNGKASGAAAGMAQTALVGEGGGPEWIVDRSTGQARKVKGPQMANLNENEYVIPTESRYRPQALGLLSMLAADLGVAGFNKGKGAARKRAYATQDRLIQSASDNATLFQTRMNTAETNGDAKLYETNKKAVAGALSLELNRIIGALGSRFKPKGARLTMLKQNRADVEGLIASNKTASFPAADISTYTADEQKKLDDLNKQLALAGLTTTTADDLAALQKIDSFLGGILFGAGNGEGRGGATAITQIASDIRSTRDQIKGITGGSSADQVALDQINSFVSSYRQATGQFGGNFSSAGGSASSASGAQVRITNNYQAPPEDPHSWSAGLAYELKAAL
jgi:TP901 family phage tail tape measure protein